MNCREGTVKHSREVADGLPTDFRDQVGYGVDGQNHGRIIGKHPGQGAPRLCEQDV